ncbi:MAG TPA: sulfatase [Tepidisphaeraceae bacterium]|nr:sulfatase [Tepidisphaeraceae bacterium]
MNTRHLLHRCIVVSSILLAGFACRTADVAPPAGADHELSGGQALQRQPNILFITADDLGFDSLGCTGCPLPDISPNLDRLARQGLLIDHCHVAQPVCGPSRAAFITGTWPHRNGVMGHYNQPPKWFGPSPITTNLPELLRSQGGYYTGVICKNPTAQGWDVDVNHLQAGLGRDPSKFEQLTRDFIAAAAKENKPFFLHANPMDPHEYWAGQEYETKAWIDAMMMNKPYETYPNGKPYPDPQVTYSADQIPVPPCWPNNAAMREDLRTYFNSVRRLDEVVGGILKGLQASGQEDNTLIVFISDHGIGRAFAKWSLYPLGTRTPMIVKWPGVVKPGRRDSHSVISAIDVAPTLLEAAGVAVPDFMDARSILSILRDTKRREKREMVFTCWNYMNNYPEQDAKFPAYTRDLHDKFDNYRPSRAIHSTRYTYVWNGWSDGKNEIPLEMSSSRMIRKILLATGHEDRARFEALRAREEFYDTVKDPGCLVNLINEPTLAQQIHEFRTELLKTMERTNDHETPNFRSDFQASRGAHPTGS